ncbi:MAG: Omp28-related outer membrane protein [Bacteroidetes bacterium]|nr:Omp28-related outer membrane protein [Bacteroidota bacterium]
MRMLIRSTLIAVLFALPLVAGAQTTARTTLIEQFTGTWCQWCPYGADSINSILSYIPNARALAYHQGDVMATTDGNTVIGHLLVSSYPSGAIDRLLVNLPTGGAAIAISRTYWGAVTQQRNQQGSPMSISVTGTYHQDTRQIAATVTMTALQAMTGEFYYNAVLSEDDLDYAQQKNTGSAVITVSPYYHKRVVRNMITGPYGVTLTTTGLAANQVETKYINFTVPANYDITKCKLTVFVTTKITLTVNGQPRPTQMATQQAWQEPVLTALTVIPVEMISFSATQDGDAVRVNWRTAMENNNRGWFVERRVIDGEWNDLGFVNGYGTTHEQQQYEYVDRGVLPLTTYDYRLRQVDFDGKTDYSPIYRVTATPVPTETRLLPNYPNPFNPNTFITVELSQESDMNVAVYDMLGRLVKTLATGVHPAGGHVFEWDGTDANGNAVQSGIYFARMVTPTHSATQQMQLTK